MLAAGGGLAAMGLAKLTLRADAQPTETSGKLGTYGKYLEETGKQAAESPAARVAGPKWAVTEDNILGPFYRKGALFRGKVTPPLEPGVVLLIQGRVWGFDTKKPLASAVLDLWQADEKGRYDNDDPAKPPAANEFKNRARLITDEDGRYEYETIHPGPYKLDAETWRPCHIHYLVRAKGYKQLVTQLYFEGDPHNAGDVFIKKSLIIPIKKVQVGKQSYEAGTFDVVLAKE
jgi:protocatechuate 3,4-dioxygenase beta subunit